jgi:hypothetical protein
MCRVAADAYMLGEGTELDTRRILDIFVETWPGDCTCVAWIVSGLWLAAAGGADARALASQLCCAELVRQWAVPAPKPKKLDGPCLHINALAAVLTC